jgi:succinyl-CoA synthetase beta subunit
MRLLEDVLKPLLSTRGVAVPRGLVIDRAEDLALLMETTDRAVLKALVPANDRARAQQVVTVGRTDATAVFERLTRGGQKVWAEEYVEHSDELFVGLVWPGDARVPVLLTSAAGGQGVTERDRAVTVHRQSYDAQEPLSGPLASISGVDAVVRSMATLFEDLAAISLEVNPLVVGPRGRLVALDAKAYLDPYGDRALPVRVAEPETNECLLEFSRLNGGVGVISIGAGLTRAVVDWLTLCGPGAACFSDLIPAVLSDVSQLLSGETGPECIRASAWVASDLMRRGRSSLLVNLVSGGTPIDALSRSVMAGLHEAGWQGRVVVHVAGNRSSQAAEAWRSWGVDPAADLGSAIAAAT